MHPLCPLSGYGPACAAVTLAHSNVGTDSVFHIIPEKEPCNGPPLSMFWVGGSVSNHVARTHHPLPNLTAGKHASDFVTY